jgi:hypothetical protein
LLRVFDPGPDAFASFDRYRSILAVVSLQSNGGAAYDTGRVLLCCDGAALLVVCSGTSVQAFSQLGPALVGGAPLISQGHGGVWPVTLAIAWNHHVTRRHCEICASSGPRCPPALHMTDAFADMHFVSIRLSLGNNMALAQVALPPRSANHQHVLAGLQRRVESDFVSGRCSLHSGSYLTSHSMTVQTLRRLADVVTAAAAQGLELHQLPPRLMLTWCAAVALPALCEQRCKWRCCQHSIPPAAWLGTLADTCWPFEHTGAWLLLSCSRPKQQGRSSHITLLHSETKVCCQPIGTHRTTVLQSDPPFPSVELAASP